MSLVWKIQEFSNRRWRSIHFGSEVDMREQFQKLMLKPGRRRLVDENKKVIAKVSLAYAEIQVEDDRP